MVNFVNTVTKKITKDERDVVLDLGRGQWPDLPLEQWWGEFPEPLSDRPSIHSEGQEAAAEGDKVSALPNMRGMPPCRDMQGYAPMANTGYPLGRSSAPPHSYLGHTHMTVRYMDGAHKYILTPWE